MNTQDRQDITARQPQKLLTRTLSVANTYDFDRRSGAVASIRGIGGAAAYADLALFWGHTDNFVISPVEIASPFVAYVDSLFARPPTIVRVPKTSSDGLACAAASDDQLIDAIVNSSGPDSVAIRPWGVTRDVYTLVNALNRAGIAVDRSEISVPEKFWTVEYLDSKAGFRRFVTSDPHLSTHVRLPKGSAAETTGEVLELIAQAHSERQSVVVKSNFGCAGSGVLFVKDSRNQCSHRDVLESARQQMADRPALFASGPFVVEEFIRNAPESGEPDYGATFVECQILDADSIRIVGAGDELRDGANHYVGAEMGRDSRAMSGFKSLEDPVRVLCKAAAALGFTGRIGIDFLWNDAGAPVAIEANPRRCSEAPVYDIAEMLFGEDWATRGSVLARMPRYVQLTGLIAPETVLQAFQNTNHNLGLDTVIVPLSLTWLTLARPGIAYAVFGSDRQEIRDAEKILEHELLGAGVRVT